MENNKEIINLIKDYFSSEEDLGTFQNYIPTDLLDNISLPKELVSYGIKEEEDDCLYVAVSIMLMQYNSFGLTPDIEAICQLLVCPVHFEHETIAFFLAEIKNPLTIDCLYKATELELAYLDYDDTYQFARKCIKALYAIGTNKAIEKLEMLGKNRNGVIANYAIKELKKRK